MTRCHDDVTRSKLDARTAQTATYSNGRTRAHHRSSELGLRPLKSDATTVSERQQARRISFPSRLPEDTWWSPAGTQVSTFLAPTDDDQHQRLSATKAPRQRTFSPTSVDYQHQPSISIPAAQARSGRRGRAGAGDLAGDDNSDDNPDDSRTPNNAHNCRKMVLSCLVRYSAWSWQCGGTGSSDV